MPQWKRAARLDFPQRKAGVNVFHVRQAHEFFQGELAEGFQVLGHHLHLKGAGAADVVAGHDFRHLFDRFFEPARGVCAVAVGIQPYKGQYAQADFVAIDLSPVTGDEAGLFKCAHASPAGRGRQADPRGQLGIGLACIGLQLYQNSDVKLIECFHKLYFAARFLLFSC